MSFIRKAIIPSPKGFIADQKRMMWSPALSQTWSAIFEYFSQALKPKQPARSESFEEAVQRLGYTQEQLERSLDGFKRNQLIMYFVAGLVAVYGLHSMMSGHALVAVTTWVCSAALAVRGYLFAFRAWQIQNRSLTPLMDAIRNPRSYLVL